MVCRLGGYTLFRQYWIGVLEENGVFYVTCISTVTNETREWSQFSTLEEAVDRFVALCQVFNDALEHMGILQQYREGTYGKR